MSESPAPASPVPAPQEPRVRAPRVTADRGSTFRTLLNLWPYMWPADRPYLKQRVLLA